MNIKEEGIFNIIVDEEVIYTVLFPCMYLLDPSPCPSIVAPQSPVPVARYQISAKCNWG